VNLRPFIRPGLDVLFLALSPPEQSNTNGHYFSGGSSRFYTLLYASRLITKPVLKSLGDEIVFGGTAVNHKNSEFGVIDLVDDLVQTNSRKVRPTRDHVDRALTRVRQFQPRFVCVIHYKVRDSLNRHAGFTTMLDFGMCGPILADCKVEFVLNYFPNGNSISDAPKLAIFRALRDAL